MKIVLLFAGLISLTTVGCMSGYYGRYERERMAERDSLQPPPMTVDDIIALSKDSVGEDVIISQIRATHSYFQLSTDDIIKLKKEGVSEKVIDAMIRTDEEPRYRRRPAYYPMYYPYPAYYWYANPWYYWYPSVRIGYSFYGSRYVSHGFGVHRLSGARR